MEDITTELKLKIAQLEKEKKEIEEKFIKELRESERLINSLMLDVQIEKQKVERLYNTKKITKDDLKYIRERL